LGSRGGRLLKRSRTNKRENPAHHSGGEKSRESPFVFLGETSREEKNTLKGDRLPKKEELSERDRRRTHYWKGDSVEEGCLWNEGSLLGRRTSFVKKGRPVLWGESRALYRKKKSRQGKSPAGKGASQSPSREAKHLRMGKKRTCKKIWGGLSPGKGGENLN